MGKLNVMDQTGHTEFQFDDPKAPNYLDPREGQKKFDELIAGGARMAAKRPDGIHEPIKAFDATREMVQIPQLAGG